MIHVPEGYVNVCVHCGKSFFSGYSDLIASGATIRGNSEQCQHCRKMTPAPDYDSLVVGGQTVAVPSGFKLAKRGGTPRATSNTILLGLQYRGQLFSSVWKIWQNKGDVYLSNRDFASWKASFHASGQDLVSLTAEHLKALQIERERRPFMKATRGIPPLGHFFRVACINFRATFEHQACIYKTVKRKDADNLTLLDVSEFGKEVQITCGYTDGHPDLYHSTYVGPRERIGLIKGSRNHYFSVFVSSGSSAFVSEHHETSFATDRFVGDGQHQVIKISETRSKIFMFEEEMLGTSDLVNLKSTRANLQWF